MEEGYLSFLDEDALWFPPVDAALSDGLLAVGGDLSVDRLLLAYRSGIFPWFNEEDPILWWSPDPRCVLFPEGLKVSKSMKALLKKEAFDFRMDTDFEQTIISCATVPREGQPGTWITPDIAAAYIALHQQGYAHSAEAWQDGQLVGGLYGVLLGKVFFGESMFSRVSNASKYAFIRLVQQLQDQGIRMIDCQMHTPHLESLGAELIPRSRFIRLLKDYL